MRAAYKIRHAGDADRERWDAYVRGHPDASHSHAFGWRSVIHGTYGHATHYLMLLACDDPVDAAAQRPDGILGVLPLVHFRHAIFGNSLVSMPFLDGGGILASNTEAEEALLNEAIKLGREIGARRIELRHTRPLSACNRPSTPWSGGSGAPEFATRSDKALMLLPLPESSEALMRSFRSKLRSQITKPLRAGLTAKTGGTELLEDFYQVFLVTMRDLGSPVHSMELMRNTLSEFPERSKVIVVYKSAEPVAAALVIGFGSVLRNPWASSLRKYASLSPNMLLYLRILEYACDNGYRAFDFGRSSIGEGTYKFKEQWGAVPVPLYWHYIYLDGHLPDPDTLGKQRFAGATRCWKRLPVVVTRAIGPSIRKHISL